MSQEAKAYDEDALRRIRLLRDGDYMLSEHETAIVVVRRLLATIDARDAEIGRLREAMSYERSTVSMLEARVRAVAASGCAAKHKPSHLNKCFPSDLCSACRCESMIAKLEKARLDAALSRAKPERATGDGEPPQWGVFDTWERKWCPRVGTEQEMGLHAVKLSVGQITKPGDVMIYRFQPLPLPPRDAKEGG